MYPEVNQPDAPVPLTHYPTPGLERLSFGPTVSPVRCLYRASNGELYTVIGNTVYYVPSNYILITIGTMPFSPLANQVSMIDNGLALVIVDGSSLGYAMDLNTRAFGQITGSAFYGADRVDYLDTYFIFNRPNTNQFYISLSNVTYAMLIAGSAFDALDLAAKIGYPDKIATLIVMHREIWLIGTLTTEIWYNSGATDFTFEQLPGSFIEHGCVARYTIAKQDLCVYFLSQDLQGQLMVLEGQNYTVKRISTHAIENEFLTYPNVSDAIGFTYQQEGHTFYVLIFPSANKTWVYDISTQLWHERAWTDSDGNLNRHRMNCGANAYGNIVVGDWQNGALYALDLNTYTDFDGPISRIRSFPHLIDDANRISYKSFIADMAVGEDDGTIDSSTPFNPPVVALRWSDTRGASWGSKVEQSMGSAGQYLTSIQWSRLGLARDRVFELSWSAPTPTALNGAFIDTIACET